VVFLAQVKISRSGLFALIAVYLIWGSSFLAIRLAVSGSGAFPPYTFAALRTLIAGALLLGWSLSRGHSLAIGWPSFRWLAFTGILLWVGGHSLVIWAEQRMDSGLAALIFASTPLWSVFLAGFWSRGEWNFRRFFPALVGFIGVALVLPLNGTPLGGGLMIDGAALLLSAFFWALGSVLGSGPARDLPITVSTGLQLFSAGIVNLLIAALAGETLAAPGLRAALAGTHLILLGTVVAYLAYAHTVRTLPISWVMSFAYVNPVVAMALGYFVLREPITFRAFAGTAIVVGSVGWLFLGSRRISITNSAERNLT